MYTLSEQGDVFVDACASDHLSQLLFLSAYGRDTSIQQFMARLHVDVRQGGVDSVTICGSTATERLRVLVGDPKRLTKLTGRMPKTGLLGNLVHAWIFDPALLEIDYAGRAAWFIRQVEGGATRQDLDATWRLILELSPVPLLAHWSLPTVAYLRSRGALVTPPSIGPIQATRLEMPEDFPSWVSARVRAGDFTERPAGIHAEPRPVLVGRRAA